MIDDRELSVVVQGPLLSGQEEGIARCLDSVRRVLPGAEVVVSTWENEDARAIAPPVRVVQSPDPGGFPLELERPYNLNRLQRSTAAGLAAATRRYCLKLRTDLAVADRRFLALGARRDG